jgi:hypothetical protein
MKLFTAALLCIFLSVPAYAKGKPPKNITYSYSVGVSKLSLTVPEKWKNKTRKALDPDGVNIRFYDDGNAFSLWLAAEPAPDGFGDEAIKNALEYDLESIRPQAEETEFPLVPLDTGTLHGFYFTATDRTIKPGEYKYLTQGVASARGGVRINFSIYTHDGHDNIARQVLEAVKTIKIASP